MQVVIWRKYGYLAKAQLRYNFRAPLVLALLLLGLVPVLFGIDGLKGEEAAVPLEMFAALLGIVLLPPIFQPEQESAVRELIASKFTSLDAIYGLRAIMAIVMLSLLLLGLSLVMLMNGSDFPILRYAAGTFAGAYFLGALGLLAYSMTSQIAVGYMVPLVYYVFNLFGADNFGPFALFSISKVNSFVEKYWLAGAGMLFLLAALAGKAVVRRRT